MIKIVVIDGHENGSIHQLEAAAFALIEVLDPGDHTPLTPGFPAIFRATHDDIAIARDVFGGFGTTALASMNANTVAASCGTGAVFQITRFGAPVVHQGGVMTVAMISMLSNKTVQCRQY